MKLTYEQALEAVNAGRLPRKDGFVEIPTNVFVERIDVGMAPLPSIAFFHEPEAEKVLRKADQPYSPLALSARESVWVREEDLGVMKTFAENILVNPKASSMTPEKRMESLRKSAMLVVEDLFENPSPENINKSNKVVSSFVHVLMKDPKAYILLAKLSSHDPYTLQHSVGTAVNCIILARKIGINQESELQEIGMAGLLHDLGKTRVKKEIINKEGPLDEQEWEEMRGHSSFGYELIKDNPTLTERTKRAVLEHHEDKTCTGYPNRTPYNEVDLYSKIVCISDVFNALTTNRSYSKARSPFEAFQLMRDKISGKIDDDLFKQLVMIYGGKLPE